MAPEFLEDRRRALEEVFFAQQTEAWRQRQRDEVAATTRRQALQEASGITDTALLDRLVGQGVEAATLAALSLVPLVMVAWADGPLDDKERAALLAAAAESGIRQDSPAQRFLIRWLSTRPPPALLDSWEAYIRASTAKLDPTARQVLKSGLLDRAHRVAESAGTFLGLPPRINPAAAAVLGRLERAFGA